MQHRYGVQRMLSGKRFHERLIRQNMARQGGAAQPLQVIDTGGADKTANNVASQ